MVVPSLRERVALVTGANHGIGAAIAEALAAQGTRVFLTYYRTPTVYSTGELEQALAAGVGGDALYRARQQQAAGPVLERIRARGGMAEALEADLRDPDSVPRLFEQCEAALGGVDILVNNHTHCVLETFDPALVSAAGGGYAASPRRRRTRTSPSTPAPPRCSWPSIWIATWRAARGRAGSSTSAPMRHTHTRRTSATRRASTRWSPTAALPRPNWDATGSPSTSSRRDPSRPAISRAKQSAA